MLQYLKEGGKMELFIKVCVDPHCEAVFHNIPKNVTHCADCYGNIIVINKKTYIKKFINNYFQYNFENMEYYYPFNSATQLSLF